MSNVIELDGQEGSILWLITIGRRQYKKDCIKMAKELKGKARDIALCILGKYKGNSKDIKKAAKGFKDLHKRLCKEAKNYVRPTSSRGNDNSGGRGDTYSTEGWTEKDYANARYWANDKR